MSSINGFGTLYYGWRHFQDGTSTATKWLALFYIPVIPLQRHTLKVLTDFTHEGVQVKPIAGGLLGVSASQMNHYLIVKKTPLVLREAFITYLKTYVVLPILMFWPFCLAVLLGSAFAPLPDSFLLMAFSAVCTVSTLISALAWPIWAIRQSRGKKF